MKSPDPVCQEAAKKRDAMCASLPSKAHDYFYAYMGVLFVLGLSMGVLLSVLGFRYFLFRFGPEPKRMAQEISERIAREYGLAEGTQRTIEKIIEKNQHEIMATVEESFQRIEDIKRNLAGEIAELLPDEQGRDRWLAEYDDYFPRPPRTPFSGNQLPPPGAPGMMPPSSEEGHRFPPRHR